MAIATTGILVDDSWYLLVNTIKFTHLTDLSLSINDEMIDITSFDSGVWTDQTPGKKIKWVFSGNAHYALDGTENGEQVFDDLTASTGVTVLLSTTVSGDTTYSGTAYYSGKEIGIASGSATSLSFTLEGTGALTKSTVA